MPLEYDLHLSAYRLSRSTIFALEQLGFARDEFANNTRCVASEYHATFRATKWLPDDAAWARICSILLSDVEFVGCLEEESIDRRCKRDIVCVNGPEPIQLLPKIPLKAVPPGAHKACDIHIGIDLVRSHPDAIQILESLETASFDKPTGGGTKRVYTITCETCDDGLRMFEALYDHLSRTLGLDGKMKLETTTRYLRHPDDADTLPLMSTEAVAFWLSLLPSFRLQRNPRS